MTSPHGSGRKARGSGLHVTCFAAGMVALGCWPAGVHAEPIRGLTAAPQLAAVYDTIFDARFESVPEQLDRACPPAPQEVCRVLDAVARWWQIQLNPHDRSLDREFLERIDYAVASAATWTTREPDRAEAWFYLGGAYGARVQWRVLRGERLAAARDGKRIKDALERALELDPDMHDAWFGIGLYHYYADVAPAAAKVLRWLLFLPGGDRVRGLQEMVRARDHGTLLRSEADYQLQTIYLWYEDEPARALELLEGLRSRHATNPHFLQLIAEVQDVYQHDLTASLRSWRALYEAAVRQHVKYPAMAEARARLGMALQLDRLFETDLAIEHLRALIASKPTAPFGAMAQAYVQLGAALRRMGYMDEAVAAYHAALSLVDDGDDPLALEARARDGLRHRPDPQAAAAYRLSVEGWRALQRGDLARAARAIDESLTLQPRDAVTRYRQARLLQARRQDAAALRVLEAITDARGATPPTIYALACVEAARLLEARDPARAIALYRSAQGVFGADQRTKDAARRALARLDP